MTARAIILGLLCACVVCGFTYFNDNVMKQTMLIGNSMPISIYGALILFLLIVNPLLRRFRAAWTFTRGELAVMLSLTLVACCVPGSNLMRTFGNTQMLPHHYAKTELGWQEQKIMEMVPPEMLADVSENEDVALYGFVRGMGEGDQHISVKDVPWGAWRRTLSFWLPLLLIIWVGMIGLALVIHRQWAEHEHLPYPIAAFVEAMLPEKGKALGGVFTNRLFWIGAGAVLVIHLNNLACLWFPEQLFKIPNSFDFTALRGIFRELARGSGWEWGFWIARPTFYLSVVAFAYFITKDASLALGLGPLLFVIVRTALAGFGVSLGGGNMSPRLMNSLHAGAFFAMFLALVYTGRYYYGAVFRKAFFLKSSQGAGPEAVWGARVFLLSLVAFVVSTSLIGLDWQLGLIYIGALTVAFVVMSRMMAETGVFFLQSFWYPCTVVWAFLGTKALGPQPVLIMIMLSVVLILDPREALMPYVVNSFKLVDVTKQKLGKLAAWSSLTLVVALMVAVPVTLYQQYDRGTEISDNWAYTMAPKFSFEEAVRVKQRLVAQESLAEAEALSGWQRFAHAKPSKIAMVGMAIGFGLVLLFIFCRMRFANWPLHPVMFLVMGTWAGKTLAWSFLLGWLVKSMVVKFAGAGGYQKLKALMFGVIAGEMTAGIIALIISVVYYLVTGEIPKSFKIMPI